MMTMNLMRHAIACLTLTLGGCAALPSPDPTDQSDIRNWDFSACLDDTDTCVDLLLDNQEVILGGHTLVSFIIEGLKLGTTRGGAQIDFDLGGSGFLPPPQTPDAPDQADIRSWDFTACLDDFESFGTCSDLLLDNAEIILGGRSLVEAIVDGWTL